MEYREEFNQAKLNIDWVAGNEILEKLINISEVQNRDGYGMGAYRADFRQACNTNNWAKAEQTISEVINIAHVPDQGHLKAISSNANTEALRKNSIDSQSNGGKQV